MTPSLQPVPEKSHGGGPRTQAGKAISSQNAITFGLFAVRDFIRPGEQSIYDEFAQDLQTELAPAGILEQSLADEIRRAMWRLRRCAQIEESFSGMAEDPMQRDPEARLQLSVDRARSQSHRLLHKCTAELRKLQTERLAHSEVHVIAPTRPKPLPIPHPQPESSFCKSSSPSPLIARGQPCPCGSGEKYKRCCGRNAPPLLYAA